jgi:endoglucanase
LQLLRLSPLERELRISHLTPTYTEATPTYATTFPHSPNHSPLLDKMRLLHLLPVLVGLVTVAAQPAVPLHTDSRWILDANNRRVKMRCVNWAGHMEAHIPEGLHKQSVEWLADWIARQGFNCVRLTYATDHALNPGLKVSDAFVAAAAAAGADINAMTGLYAAAVQKNPWLSGATTRDVFGKIVDALWAKGVMTILDNHVSKASWCCNLEDGNGWWDTAFGYNAPNSRFFNTENWVAGLQQMAMWARGRPGVVGMGVRNELREFLVQNLNGRDDWYSFVTRGAKTIHEANPDVLILIGGSASSTDMTHLRSRPMDTSAWAGKNVWEWHAYAFTVTFTDFFDSCFYKKQAWGMFDGFLLEQGKPYTGPLILSEFGVGMSGGPRDGLTVKEDNYLKCLSEYMSGNDGDWAVWAIQGSYYVRDKQVDMDEYYGLMNHDWTDWRNPTFKNRLGDMWKQSQGP